MRTRLGADDGFTTVAVMITLMLASLLAAAAFATANNGTPLARADQNTKEAYAAAEAGIAFYEFHLSQDPNYWTYCTTPPTLPTPNPLWDGISPSTRNWRDVPTDPNTGNVSSPTAAQYSITLVPPAGSKGCVANQADTTFLNPATGTFTIRSTGRYRGKMRSIDATFRRKTFVDFLWYTNYETPDPLTHPLSNGNVDPNCVATYHRDGRPEGECQDQEFINNDEVTGPMHTNDRFFTCGQPVFGGSSSDAIEETDPNPKGYEASPSCGAVSPKFVGTLDVGADPLDMPPDDDSIKNDVLPNGPGAKYLFTGPTTLHFTPGDIEWTQGTGSSQTSGQEAYPSNGLIYVQSSGCSAIAYQDPQTYDPKSRQGCGDATISGQYPSSLTVATDGDIIVADDLTRVNAGTEMGLVANGFVRVYHPVTTNALGQCVTASNSPPFNKDPDGTADLTIDAAILSVSHSFLVDNNECGPALGRLTVNGAIAQQYRGTVGRNSNGNVTSGYTKNYVYDQQLRYIDPPYFLDPVKSAWHVIRETEQVPAV